MQGHGVGGGNECVSHAQHMRARRCCQQRNRQRTRPPIAGRRAQHALPPPAAVSCLTGRPSAAQ
jgi:hypothetical protein